MPDTNKNAQSLPIYYSIIPGSLHEADKLVETMEPDDDIHDAGPLLVTVRKECGPGRAGFDCSWSPPARQGATMERYRY